MLSGNCDIPIQWELTQWNAPNWQRQILFHHVRAYLLGPNKRKPDYSYLYFVIIMIEIAHNTNTYVV
jgi:hypothetical protein